MSQTTTDNVLRIWVLCSDDVLSGTSQELLDLRAAVRRVLEAEVPMIQEVGTKRYEDLRWAFGKALAALRAEMASLDGNGNGGAS